jgi:hypothetical protein
MIIPVVRSRANLRLLQPPATNLNDDTNPGPVDVAIVKANAVIGDEAGGAFVWVPNSTLADDNADIIASTVAGAPPGRWINLGAGGQTLSSFGDGSDGSVTLDGVTAFAGFSNLAAQVYTLTRDVFFANLTINTGVTLNTAGFRVFCTGTVNLIGTANINDNGGAGGTASGGGAAGAATAAGTTVASKAGGAGGTNGSGSAGSNGANQQPGGAAGGAGGAGTNAGGAGGTFNAVAATVGQVRTIAQAETGIFMAQGGNVALGGGAGGGGGGSSAAGTGGGGGGGGGGVLILAAQNITCPATASIQANGGAGGAATGGGVGGGGGGGAGGVLILIVRNNNIVAGQAQANGGAGGAAVGGGVAGSVGGAGSVITIAA